MDTRPANKDLPRKELQNLIQKKVLRRGTDAGYEDLERDEWIFDFKTIVLNPEHLALITDALWEEISDMDAFQLGGLESASIPLITALVIKARQEGKRVNGFYIRKSRKKVPLFKQIEGGMNNDPVVLVDDILNTGNGIRKQIAVLDRLGKKVFRIAVIVRYREKDAYPKLRERAIELRSVFAADDFSLPLISKKQPSEDPYRVRLLFAAHKASFRYVAPKSTPALAEGRLYFGTDAGVFYAIDATTGEVAWSIRMGLDAKSKSIFSSPLVYKDIVVFGSYDGKLYALDRASGKPKWTFSDCEWIGSSPAAAPDLDLIFIGLEHGLPGHHGSLVALYAETGEKKWEYRTPAFTHASPLYIQEHAQVCCGGNEGVLRLFDAATGSLLWQFETEGGASYEGCGGFSAGDIKLSPAYDGETDSVVFCSMDGWMYSVRRADGVLRFRVPTEFPDTDIRIGIFGKPLVSGENIIFGGLDKCVYCYNKRTGEQVWRQKTGGRIFASPIVVNNRVFIGSNDGKLYELSKQTGKAISTTQFSERITNEAVYDGKETLYVTTHANEIYTLALNSGVIQQ